MADEFLRFLVREAEERATKYRMYREYYDGEHDVHLTPRQRKYLQIGPNQEFSANYMPIIVDSLANRLEVDGFDGDNGETVWDWWQRDKMDANQFAVNHSTIRDGDAYVMVDWDTDNQRPVFVPHLAYDGRDGCTAHYSAEQVDPIVVTKRWSVEFGPMAGKIRRLNLYYPDRIERFYSNESIAEYGWMPYDKDGFGPVLPWLDRAGQPLGIPIVHFTNRARGMRHGLSELEAAIPMQNALNKSVVDLLAAADASGFRIMVMVGDDAANVTVSPGVFINSLKPAEDVNIQAIPGEPMRPLIETVDSFVQRIGQVSDTPLSYFQQSGQMASEGTHASHEARMLVKARVAALEIGTAYEKMMSIAMAQSNAFDGTSYDSMAPLQTIWKDFDARDETARLLEKAQVLNLLVQSGASIEQAAIVAGFSEKQATKLAEVDLMTDPLRMMPIAPNIAPNQQQA